MWVQPKVWQPIFYLSPLGLQPIDFIIKKKSEEPCRGGFFFGAVFSEQFFF